MNKLKKINFKVILLYILRRKIFRYISDKNYLRMAYRLKMGNKLSLNNPKTFNEKIQWLKLYDRKPIYTNLVDKFAVREYIAEKIGEEYLIPLIGVYNSFDEIDFNTLPNQFVLKCTHDSGGVVICKDKESLDKRNVKHILDRCMKRNFYFLHREWPYKNIKPKIICEQYMMDETDKELRDYKIMCFNGTAKCLFVCLNRSSSNGLNVDFYDLNWNLMPFVRRYPNSGEDIKKPKNFEKMIYFAELLSKNHPFLRVDFYEINGRLFFGELTFYPGSGYEKFEPERYDYKLGEWLDLPLENKNE